MKYSQIKQLVLSLMEQYTAGGVPVAPSYNGQADDLCRIPGFFGAGLMALYTRAMPVTKTAELTAKREFGGIQLCLLPEDCMKMLSGGVFRMTEHRVTPIQSWRPWGEKGILIPGGEGKVWVEYCPYPPALPDAPGDGYSVDVSPECAQAAAFYCAAMLLLHRDAAACTALMNEFELRADAMHRRLRASLQPVHDVLGGAMA